ncbi:hypothetical protein KAR91_80170 [Candidatus Pacearchaeota archaeon]|nr:hypothetical protein [Candidatus Pacearchaeota archaeon]
MCKFGIPFGKHKFKCKSEANWFVSIILLFVSKRFWITIWDTTYYPEAIIDPMKNKRCVKHEYKHYLQWDKFGVFFPILYLFIPFPIFFAYFRWLFERSAYLIDILEFNIDVERVVNVLWRKYLFVWPKCWMRKWFMNHVNALKGDEK